MSATLTAQSVTALQPAGSSHAHVASVTMEQLSAGEWDRAVAGFDQVSPEQTALFAAARWPSLALEPQLFRDNGTTRGGALMMVRRLPLGLGTIAIAKWSPVLADSSEPSAADAARRMIDAMIRHYAHERRMMLAVLPRAPVPGGVDVTALLRDAGFSPAATLPFPTVIWWISTIPSPPTASACNRNGAIISANPKKPA